MPSSLHGLGADQIVSINLVTADGNFVTASPTENQDIFWAIRGGGGGSAFGVVTSMVVKAFKELETTVGTVEWGVKINNITVDTSWQGVANYFSYFAHFITEGMAAEWFLSLMITLSSLLYLTASPDSHSPLSSLLARHCSRRKPPLLHG
jgi:FAD/FMN-containing dehydrogenase